MDKEKKPQAFLIKTFPTYPSLRSRLDGCFPDHPRLDRGFLLVLITTPLTRMWYFSVFPTGLGAPGKRHHYYYLPF